VSFSPPDKGDTVIQVISLTVNYAKSVLLTNTVIWLLMSHGYSGHLCPLSKGDLNSEIPMYTTYSKYTS